MDNARGAAENNNAVGGSPLTQTVPAPSQLLGHSDQNLKTKNNSMLQVARGNSTLKSERVSRKAFAVQDKVIFSF